MQDEIMKDAKERMEKSLESLSEMFAQVRTGRANAMVLDKVRVDYYGQPTPINQMAAIKTPDAHMLVIEPWDKGSLGAIEAAIASSNLGINPANDGEVIRLAFPQLTEERRKELAKECKTYAEEARVSIRNARRDANNAIQKAEKDKDSGVSEDDVRRVEAEIQKLTDSYIEKVEADLSAKESELMEI